ncbi:MAG: helix-turn-helix domain-containing protein [Acidobacteriota bacterium]
MNPAQEKKARVLALAGGKGGVGTSLLAGNLAIHLARQGWSVVLMDLDPSGAALHTQVGVEFPARNLGLRAGRRPPPLKDLLVAGGIPNLKLLAGVPDTFLRHSRDAFGADLIREAETLPCDLVIVDAGSGRSRAVQLTCRAARSLVLVATPEPNALSGTLKLQASVLYGTLEETLGARKAAEFKAALAEKGLRALLAHLGQDNPIQGKLIAAVRQRHFGFVLNQTRSSVDLEAATRVGAVLSMMQAVIIDPIITLEYDLSALQVSGERRVLSQRFPNSPVSRGLEKLAFALTSQSREDDPSGHRKSRHAPLDDWHHYRLLALDPRASPREVQRHYEWIRAPFLPGGEAEAVVSRSELDRVLALVDTAYRTLVFLENRREYDRQLTAAGVLHASDLRELDAEEESRSATERKPPRPSSPAARTQGRRRPAAPPAGGEAPHTEEIPAASERLEATAASSTPSSTEGRRARHYDGAALRELRQRRRMDIDRIAAITKIRAPQIEALETEQYASLPVPVFLKGFLRAYAHCLDLDAEDVVRDYMERYEAWAGKES